MKKILQAEYVKASSMHCGKTTNEPTVIPHNNKEMHKSANR